jgi:hypothetical protein
MDCGFPLPKNKQPAEHLAADQKIFLLKLAMVCFSTKNDLFNSSYIAVFFSSHKEV